MHKICGLLAAMFFLAPALASAQVTFTLGSATISAGSSDTIAATVASDGSAVALQFDVLYDPTVLSLNAVTAGSALTADHTLSNSSISPGRERVVITTSPVTSLLSGSLATFNIDVSAAALPGTTPLNWDGIVISDAGANPITPSSLTPGSITIIAASPPAPTPPAEAIPSMSFIATAILAALLVLVAVWKGGRTMRLMAVALFALYLVPFTQDVQAQTIPGDANGDGVINSEDVRLIVERILERGLLPGDGDCNRDQTINVLDTVCSQLPFVPGQTDPIILGPGDRSIPANIAFEMNLFAADPDIGSTLSWQLLAGPSDLSVSTAGVLAWTPGTGNLGDNTVSVRVTDDTARTNDANFTLSVFVAPDAPRDNTPPSLVVPADQALVFNTPLAVNATGSDPDGDSYSFTLVNSPTGMSIDPNTGAINWTPGAADIGPHDVSVELRDEYDAVAFDSFVVDVLNVNSAPVANDEVYEARIGETLTVFVPGVLENDTDPDGNALSSSLIGTTANGILNLNTDGSFDYTPTPPAPPGPMELEQKCSLLFQGFNLRTAFTNGTVLAGDVDNDGDIELVGWTGLTNNPRSGLFIMNADDCSAQLESSPDIVAAGEFDGQIRSHLGLADLDGDGDLEIIGKRRIESPGVAERHVTLLAANHDGTLFTDWGGNGASDSSQIVTSDITIGNGPGPNFADIDADGALDIVIYWEEDTGALVTGGISVFNGSDGTLKWERASLPKRRLLSHAPVIITDLDVDGTMEIIVDRSVISHEGDVEYVLPIELDSGGSAYHLFTSVGNFDADPFAEIVAHDEINHYLFNHDGGLVWQIARPDLSESQITVGDFDADGQAEYALQRGFFEPHACGAQKGYLAVYKGDGSLLWDHQGIEPFYATCGFIFNSPVITAFDANNDGAHDLVVRRRGDNLTTDRNGLYVFDGADGSLLYKYEIPILSTSYSSVTIADVDNDNEAEFILSWFGGNAGNTVILEGIAGNPLPPAPALVNQQLMHRGFAQEDGQIITNPVPQWLKPGANGFPAIPIQPDPLVGTVDNFTYVANDGLLNSNVATVSIDVQPAGSPPIFLSVPRTLTSVGFSYEYIPWVVDTDPGDSVSFTLAAAPAGMTMSPSGELDWVPSATGAYQVSLIASDTIGFSTPQVFTVVVGDPVEVPNVVGAVEASAESTLSGSSLVKGSVFRGIHPTAAAGSVYEQQPVAGAVAEFGSEVNISISTGPGPFNTDDDTDGFTENEGDCNDGDNSVYPGAPDTDGDAVDQDCDGIDGNKTLVAIELSPESKRVLTNEPVRLSATGIFDDGTSQNLGAVATWVRGPTFIEGTAGTYPAQASFRGVTGNASITVISRVAEDVPPIARIDSPGGGDTVIAPTDIVGTVTDDNLLRWELSYQPAGESEFTFFAEGSSETTSGVIDQFDPTTLFNGLYTIRLRAFDAGGNVSEDTTTALVDSQLKVGNFTLNYVDLELPLNGIPITLARSYDSRDKRQGDFGVGWQLGVNSIEIRTNRELGTGWEVFKQGLTYGLVGTDVHIAALRMPGGRVEAFEMVVGPSASPIVPFPPFSQSVSFRPLPGTLGTLESLDENNISILDQQPGPVSLRLDSNGDVYNPTLFRYTTPEGFKLDLDRVDGLQRAETPAGQVLTITPTSITHSNGTFVSIERDELNRITRVTDPEGFSQTYTYDANGDLRAHEDQEGFATRFDYDSDHNVINITDPLNRSLIRNDYDDDGRLIAATNANGDTIRYIHDLAGRREISSDPAGFDTVYEYDENGNVVRATDPLGGVTTSTFDARGNRLSETNPEGEATTFTYDESENLLTVSNSLNATTSYTYDERSLRISETDALGRVTRFEYDTSGRLKRYIDATGAIRESSARDGEGNLVAKTDARGNTRRFEYDSNGYQTVRTDERGNRATRVFNANGRAIEETDARGGQSLMSLDRRGLPFAVSTPNGRTMDFTFDAVGGLTEVADADANRSLHVVDATGRVIRSEDPDGREIQLSYDSRGLRSRRVDNDGRVTRYEYDALRRMVRQISPGGGVLSFTYDEVGRKLSETDANGNVTHYEYDAAGRNTALVDALGNRTEFSFDAVGNLITRLDARGNLEIYGYDALNRQTQTQYADGSRETIAYDNVGNKISETDQLGRIKSYAYDAANNLISVTEFDGGQTQFAYDANNNRTQIIDSRGNRTWFSYDANDQLVEKRFPDGSVEQYQYNTAGRIARTLLPDGKFIDASYDGSGRELSKNLSGEATESYDYDGAGRLAQQSNLWGTVDYAYDPDGRVNEIRSEGGHVVRYAYDALGNRISISTQLADQAERLTRYTYDALNRLSSVLDPDSDTTTYSYDPVGNVASINYANGVTSSFTYDSINQLSRIEHRQGVTTLATYDYTLDDAGRRLRVDHSNGDSVSYSYDTADRLLHETHRNANSVVIFEQTYAYDNVGNRLTQQVSGQAETIFAYDSADKLLSAGATSFGYDANGRLTVRNTPQGTISYSYDVEGQLLRVTTPLGTATYGYDASGKRRQRVAHGNEQNFLLDEASLTGYDQTLLAFDGADNPLTEYHWGDRLLSADDGSNDRFYHFDANRNTRLLTDEAGAVSDSYNYDAFGNIRERTGTADSPYGFAGEWQEASAGLVYLRARFYDPETGRFISRDPFAGNATDPMSLHRYLYANANPVMNVDPSGQISIASLSIGFLIGADIALITSYVAGETLQEAIPKAVLAGVFGAASVLTGGLGSAGVTLLEQQFASRFASVIASQVARKWIVTLAHATAQAAIGTFLAVGQLWASGDINYLAKSKGDGFKAFTINFVFELITRGYWEPRFVDPASQRGLAAGRKGVRDAVSYLDDGADTLFEAWLRRGGSEDLATFLINFSRNNADTAGGALAANISRNMSAMSAEAITIISSDLVNIKVFLNREAAQEFIGAMKELSGPLWDYSIK